MAFFGAFNLFNIAISKNVAQIEELALWTCANLNKITFEGDVPYIDATAFSETTTTAYYPVDNDTWTEAAMQDYGGDIEWVPHNNGVEIIAHGICGEDVYWILDVNGKLMVYGSGAMDNMGENNPWEDYLQIIKTVTIEVGVTSIGDCAFDGCKNLSALTLSEGLLEIGHRAFAECSNLAELHLPDSIQFIGKSAFNHCDKITEIVIPEEVTLDNAVFSDCVSLTSVAFLNDEMVISAGLFAGCINLQEISLPPKTAIIKETAFEQCISLKALILPESIEYIGRACFAGCEGFYDFTIPAGVKEIGSYAFFDCRNLNTITFLGDAPVFLCDEYDKYAYTFENVEAIACSARIMTNISIDITELCFYQITLLRTSVKG